MRCFLQELAEIDLPEPEPIIESQSLENVQMICSRDKKHGQEILAKLRADGEVWVTAKDPRPKGEPQRRVRVVLLAEDEGVEQYLEYLVLWGQRLWIMHTNKDGAGRLFQSHCLSGVHPIKDKYIFGRVAEQHDRE